MYTNLPTNCGDAAGKTLAWVRFNDPGMFFEADANDGGIIKMHLPSAMFTLTAGQASRSACTAAPSRTAASRNPGASSCGSHRRRRSRGCLRERTARASGVSI